MCVCEVLSVCVKGGVGICMCVREVFKCVFIWKGVGICV